MISFYDKLVLFLLVLTEEGILNSGWRIQSKMDSAQHMKAGCSRSNCNNPDQNFQGKIDSFQRNTEFHEEIKDNKTLEYG